MQKQALLSELLQIYTGQYWTKIKCNWAEVLPISCLTWLDFGMVYFVRFNLAVYFIHFFKEELGFIDFLKSLFALSERSDELLN